MELRIAIVVMLLLSTSFNETWSASACTTKLTIESLFKKIKNNHPDLKAALIDVEIAKAKLLGAQGIFDPNLNLSHDYKRYNSSSEISEAQAASLSEASINFLTRYGAKLELGGQRNRGDIKTPVSPTGDDGDYYAAIKMPLLRGAGLNRAVTNEIKHAIKVNQAQNDYRVSELLIFLTSTEAYYNWIASYKTLEIEQALIDLAKFRVNFVKSLSKSGDMALIDLAEANQELERRRGRVFEAERIFQTAGFQLSWYLWDDTGQQTVLLDKCDVPDVTFTKQTISDKAIAALKLDAIQNRPELKNLSLTRSLAKVDRDLAKNELLPRLDGFVKTGHQFGADAMAGVSGQAGLEFELPLFRREAKGLMAQAENEIQRLTFAEKTLLASIFIQIETATANINYLAKQNDAAQEELKFAKQIEQGEREKFKHGDSTLFILNRRERATAEAEIKLVNLQQSFNIARVYLKAVTGTLV